MHMRLNNLTRARSCAQLFLQIGIAFRIVNKIWIGYRPGCHGFWRHLKRPARSCAQLFLLIGISFRSAKNIGIGYINMKNWKHRLARLYSDVQYGLTCRFSKVWQGYLCNLWFGGLLGVLYLSRECLWAGREPFLGTKIMKTHIVLELSGGSLLGGAKSSCGLAENFSWGSK